MLGMTAGRAVDVVSPVEGRLPTSPGEVVVSPGLADVGDERSHSPTSRTPARASTSFTVVGLGTTTAWAERPVLYVTADDARSAIGLDGGQPPQPAGRRSDAGPSRRRRRGDPHRCRSERFDVPSIPVDSARRCPPDRGRPRDGGDHDRAAGDRCRRGGDDPVDLHHQRADRRTDPRGGDHASARWPSPRALRRRLRRTALTITAIGAALGVPLGIFIANYIARLVLERFAGVTPDVGVSVPVAVASFAVALLSARIVAARAARRATSTPLVDALRDSDGRPYGQRWLDRAATRLRAGGPLARLASRSHVRHRARSLALGAQIAAALGAAITVTSLYSSVSDLSERELEGWNWQTQIRPVDLAYPFPEDDPSRSDELELGVASWGTLDGWDIDVTGLQVDTTIIDTEVSDGRWLTETPREAVVAESFARRTGIELGDQITVELASGPTEYRVSGLHPVFGREIIVNRADLAADLDAVGFGNRMWAVDEATGAEPQLGVAGAVPLRVTTIEQLYAEDLAARQVILALFTAIGLIVVAVATLSVASTMAVQLYERRHEIATMQAIGSTRAVLRRLVTTELAPLVAVGLGVGTIAGWLGARGGHRIVRRRQRGRPGHHVVVVDRSAGSRGGPGAGCADRHGHRPIDHPTASGGGPAGRGVLTAR